MQKRAVIRRTVAGAAVAAIVSLPLIATAGAQTETDPTTGVTTTTAVAVNTTARPTSTTVGSTLARTGGGDWAVPLAVAGGGVAIAVGARRLARRPAF